MLSFVFWAMNVCLVVTADASVENQEHRKLATCKEEGLIITSQIVCEDVCGVDGLKFTAELITGTCSFSGSADAEAQALALGCPEQDPLIGHACPGDYDDLKDAIEDDNLDIMCESYCTGWGASAPTAPAPMPSTGAPPTDSSTTTGSPTPTTPAPLPTAGTTTTPAPLPTMGGSPPTMGGSPPTMGGSPPTLVDPPPSVVDAMETSGASSMMSYVLIPMLGLVVNVVLK